jgi:hypothetical protein
MKQVLSLILVFSTVFSSAQSVVLKFDQGSFEISESSKLKLDQFNLKYLKNIKPKIALYGYSDTVGSKSSNMALAEKRALAIKEYFEVIGYNSCDISLNVVGETTNFGSDYSDNRCVKIELNSKNGLYDFISVDQGVQSYNVINSADTFIECEKGTVINIPAKAFRFKNGEIANNVEIIVKEYYSLNDFMLSNLTTQTKNGGFLQTGGTIFIEAKSDGKQLQLRDGKSLQIEMQPEGNAAGMKLFSGYEEDGNVKWENKPIAEPNYYGIKYNHWVSHGERYFSNWKKKRDAQNTITEYLKQNVVYPEKALKNKKCARLTVTYKIDSDGKIYKIRQRGFRPKIFDSLLVKQLESLGSVNPIYKKEKMAKRVTYRTRLVFACDECKSGAKRFSLNRRTNRYGKYLIQYPENVWSGFERRWNWTRNEAEKLVFETSNLGWLNCDAFPSSPRKTVSFAMEGEIDEYTDFKLYLPQYNGFLIGMQNEKGVYFTNIPKGTEAVAMAIKYKEGQIYLSTQKFKTTNNALIIPEYMAVTKDELSKVFSNSEYLAIN